MLKSNNLGRFVRVASIALTMMVLVAAVPARAADEERSEEAKSESHDAKKATKSPVGTWYGRAAHCPDGSVFCTEVCNGACASPCAPGTAGCTIPAELVMMPTLFADGNVTATDSGDFSRFHTTALGTWVDQGAVTTGSLRGQERFESTFLWFQSVTNSATDFGTCCFGGSIRTRFQTFFDKNNPDIMHGFVQPFFFPYVNLATGAVNLGPGGTADKPSFPTPDPLGAALPPTCLPANGCLSTFHFVIRRVQVD